MHHSARCFRVGRIPFLIASLLLVSFVSAQELLDLLPSLGEDALPAQTVPGPDPNPTPCSICYKGYVLGDPNATMNDPVLGLEVTCEEFSDIALMGVFNFEECQLIQVFAFTQCGCMLASEITDGPTDAPALPVFPPTTGPAAMPATCSLCFDGHYMANPGAIVTDPISGITVPCEELQIVVDSGVYSQNDCQILQLSVFYSCGCTPNDGSPTVAEIPTSSPVRIRPTPSPIAPTRTKFVTGQVQIRLNDMVCIMPEYTVQGYEKQTSQFFRDYLNVPISNLQTTLLKQGWIMEEARLLVLCQQELMPLMTQIQVTGFTGVDELEGSGLFSELLERTVNFNEEAFVAYVTNASPPVNEEIMKTVVSANASLNFTFATASPTTTASPSMIFDDDSIPTIAPTIEEDDDGDRDDGGLSTGAVVGTVIGVGFGVILVVGGYFYFRRY
jgi:hypothetical protein